MVSSAGGVVCWRCRLVWVKSGSQCRLLFPLRENGAVDDRPANSMMVGRSPLLTLLTEASNGLMVLRQEERSRQDTPSISFHFRRERSKHVLARGVWSREEVIGRFSDSLKTILCIPIYGTACDTRAVSFVRRVPKRTVTICPHIGSDLESRYHLLFCQFARTYLFEV